METNEEKLAINGLINAFKKNKFLIIGFVLFGIISSYYISTKWIKPMYKADTTLFIGKEETDIGISLNEINRNNVLINDYQNIAKSRLIINQVMENLDIKIPLKEFRKRMDVHIINDSRLFIVSYQSENPKMAMEIANELAQQLSIGVLQIVGVKNIRIIDNAIIPDEAESPKIIYNVIFGGLSGLVLSFALVLILFAVNDYVNDSYSIEKILQLPIIGNIPEINKKHLKKRINGVVLDQKNSYLAETYKMLRLNISYLNSESINQVLMFTSSSILEGKTTTSSNLAISMANAGNKVLLVDSDLKKPKVHNNFNIEQIPGLTNILYNKISLEKGVNSIFEDKTLHVLTSGILPSSSDIILSSDNFKEFIDNARKIYDYILIDVPPVLLVSDPMLVSRVVDGVILVVAIGETREKEILKSKRALTKVGANIIGIVLTKNKKDKVKKENYYYEN